MPAVGTEARSQSQLQPVGPAVDTITMPTLDSKPMSTARQGERHSLTPLLWMSVVVAVFVLAGSTMGIRDGAGGAVLTALACVVLAGIAFGLWGTAMAVKETDELGSRSGD